MCNSPIAFDSELLIWYNSAMGKELGSHDLQIAQAYREMNKIARQRMRLEDRYGSNTLVADIPFPHSYHFTNDYVATRQTNPAMQELVRLTAEKPGIYRLRNSGVTYHPNSATPETPFVCHFDFPLEDGGVFMSRVTTSEVVINPNKELDEFKLEIQKDSSPIIHVWGSYAVNVCRESCCNGEECRYTSFNVPLPEKTHVLDPIAEFLKTHDDLKDVNIDELDEGTRAALLREVAKRYFSTEVGNLDKYKDDYTIFEPIKRLGVITLSPVVARFDWRDEATGFDMRKYDRYLDVHIPYDIANLGLTQIVGRTHKTFEMAADYIQLHNLRTKYILGMTYEKMARLTERLGFRTFEVLLPDTVKAWSEEDFRENNPRGKRGVEMGRILVAFQETDRFLERFAA